MQQVSIAITVMDYQMVYFDRLIAAIQSQTYQNIELVLIDKTESGTLEQRLQQAGYTGRYKIVRFTEPAGFARNYNHAIEHCDGEFVFVLNLDTILEPDCIERLVEAMQIDDTVGCVSPKILRMDEKQNVYEPRVIDSVGMYLTRIIRHHDRGGGEIDCGQYDQMVYVFGVTGAGALYRDSCLKAVSINGQYYDEDFWSYREDADLSWRLQNFGWKCLYASEAVMYHVRTLKPGKRSRNSRLANMHSVKNRYLLILNNMSLRTYINNAPFILARDILVLAGVFLKEWYSLRAFGFLLRNLRRLLKKRKHLQSRIKKDMSSYWFGRRAVPIDNR